MILKKTGGKGKQNRRAMTYRALSLCAKPSHAHEQETQHLYSMSLSGLFGL